MIDVLVLLLRVETLVPSVYLCHISDILDKSVRLAANGWDRSLRLIRDRDIALG